jgi:hypothetical protein
VKAVRAESSPWIGGRKGCFCCRREEPFILLACIGFWIIKSVYYSFLVSLQLQLIREVGLDCLCVCSLQRMADGELGVDSQLHQGRTLYISA